MCARLKVKCGVKKERNRRRTGACRRTRQHTPLEPSRNEKVPFRNLPAVTRSCTKAVTVRTRTVLRWHPFFGVGLSRRVRLRPDSCTVACCFMPTGLFKNHFLFVSFGKCPPLNILFILENFKSAHLTDSCSTKIFLLHESGVFLWEDRRRWLF